MLHTKGETMRYRCCTLVALLLLASYGFAQPMADRVPADAIVYLGWQGSEALGTPYQQSHLKAVIDSTNLPQLFTEFLPRVIERLGKDDAQAASIFRSTYGIGRVVWQKPSALYFGGIELNAPNPMPKLALVCDAGTEAQATLDSINALVENLNRAGVPLVAGVHGKRFVTLSVGADISAPFAGLLGDPADKTVPPLLSRKEYAEAAAQVQKQSIITFYIDTEAALALIDQIHGNDQAGKDWANIRDAMGLSGIKRIICSAGFEGADWATQIFVAAPAPRGGMLAMLDGKPVGDEILKVIPKTATYVAATRFDLAKVFDGIRALIGDIDPNVQKMFDQGTAAISAMTAVNFKTGLLEPAGDQWAVYGDPNVGGNSMLGFVLVNKLDDAKTFEQSLDKIDMVAGNIISGETRNDGMTFTMRQTTIDGQNVRYWATPFISLSWTIANGNIYAALQPQIAASAAVAGAGAVKGGSILENPAFVNARKSLSKDGAIKAGSISYVNLQETITSSYATTLAISRMALGFSDIFGVEAPAIVIPPLHKLREHLGTAASIGWTDDAGWHSKSISPFPASEVFATEANMLLAQQALAVSILLPALNSARERANRVKCASNMRQIGMGMLMYANDHKGVFPQDLGQLIDYDLNPDVFICPSGNTQRAGPDVLRDPKKRADWVNQNSDYVFLAPGIRNLAPAATIVLHEKLEDHNRQGMNLLYGDGHVEWQPAPRAMMMIQQNAAKVNAPAK
jgi:prepilin-type processing-associated H-X9-DG protein